MRNWSRGTNFAGAAAASIIALRLAVMPTASEAQAQAYKAPRTADGKANLNGIWQALNTANWDLQAHAARPGQVVALGAIGAVPAGLGVVEGDEIPYLPAAAPKKILSLPRAWRVSASLTRASSSSGSGRRLVVIGQACASLRRRNRPIQPTIYVPAGWSNR